MVLISEIFLAGVHIVYIWGLIEPDVRDPFY